MAFVCIEIGTHDNPCRVKVIGPTLGAIAAVLTAVVCWPIPAKSPLKPVLSQFIGAIMWFIDRPYARRMFAKPIVRVSTMLRRSLLRTWLSIVLLWQASHFCLGSIVDKERIIGVDLGMTFDGISHVGVVHDGRVEIFVHVAHSTVFPDRHSIDSATPQLLTPSDAAIVLQTVKRLADTHLGCSTTSAVVTIPAALGVTWPTVVAMDEAMDEVIPVEISQKSAWRRAVRDAASAAGFVRVETRLRSQAAAVAYGIDVAAMQHCKRNVLVLDLTSNAVEATVFTTVEGRGRLVFARRLQRPGNTSSSDTCTLHAEAPTTHRDDTSLVHQLDVQATTEAFLTPAGRSSRSMLARVMHHITAALADAGLTRQNVDEVVLVGSSEGNSTDVAGEVRAIFRGTKARVRGGEIGVEIISRGAAIEANRIPQDDFLKVADFFFYHSTPNVTLGVATSDGRAAAIFPRESDGGQRGGGGEGPWDGQDEKISLTVTARNMAVGSRATMQINTHTLPTWDLEFEFDALLERQRASCSDPGEWEWEWDGALDPANQGEGDGVGHGGQLEVKSDLEEWGFLTFPRLQRVWL
ncbi:hypothetical protein HDU93_009370 [Gonapodya sp. JEL0774]|nr:hypothetical protein HDU93_009370 [Gonapodya sp. JEL0774]